MTASNENKAHKEMKLLVSRILKFCGWVTRFEEMHADTAAFLPGRQGVTVVECEQRCNGFWIKRNIQRNFANGCDRNVIAASSPQVLDKICHVVSMMPENIRSKVVVVLIDNFNAEFVRNVMERRS
jgi:hypothetical protein